jgi:hypothetical protein
MLRKTFFWIHLIAGVVADAPAKTQFGRRTVYANPYTGAVLGEGSQGVR